MQNFAFTAGGNLVFGPETRGLPDGILSLSSLRVRIPMRQGGARSLNLSTAAGVVLYMALARCGLLEAWL